jgi:hypothetical protein
MFASERTKVTGQELRLEHPPAATRGKVGKMCGVRATVEHVIQAGTGPGGKPEEQPVQRKDSQGGDGECDKDDLPIKVGHWFSLLIWSAED